ncbi:MAG: T9SS type A sorting domain-containing protein [Saprospiraceae bacterium]
MDKNNGDGEVIEKNVPVIVDTLWPGYLSATKDANETDWWIIAAEYQTNQYYKLKLTANGVEVVGKQAIGDTLTDYVGQGQAVFSPDGSKYFFYDFFIGLLMFDFDRASGQLGNFQKLHVADTLYFGGVAVSPNNRFLYVSNALYLYQFDLQASDIQASQVTIDTFDGFNSPFPANFFLMQLGPDCRIYMSTGNGTDRLHVINYPNLKGKDCGFQQHAVLLPSYNASTIPNFPNYRLGTPYPTCDSSIALVTAAVPLPPPATEVRLWPNPASGGVRLALPVPLPTPGEWALYNGMGQGVRRESLATGLMEHGLSVAGLPPGLYFWEVKSSNQRLGGGKLVVQP